MTLAGWAAPLADRRALQTVCFAALLAVSIWAAAFYSPNGEASPWYPAAGVGLAWLLVGGTRVAPVILAVQLGSAWAFTDGIVDRGLGPVLAKETLGLLGYVLVAEALVRLDLRRLDLRALAWFLALGGVVGPAWAAVTSGLVEYWSDLAGTVRTNENVLFFVGDALGVITFTPMLMLVIGAWRAHPVPREIEPETSTGEAVLGAAALVMAPLAARLVSSDATLLVLLIAALAPLVWVSLRRDPAAAALGLCVTTSVVSIVARVELPLGTGAILRVQALMLTSALITVFVTSVNYSSLRRLGSLLRARDQVAWVLTHDQDTGVLNRSGLVMAAGPSEEGGGPPEAVAVFDTDATSEAHEALGRQVTDEIVARSVERLRHALPESAVVAVVDHGVLGVTLREDAAALPAILERAEDALADPLEIEGVPIHLEPAVGVSAPGSHGEQALDQALFALRESRRRDGEPTEFDADMRVRVASAAARLTDLRRAIVDREITVHFQPIVRSVDRRLVGVEALGRWRHPTRGVLPAEHFITTAEHAGLIGDIGRVVRTEVVRMAAEIAPQIAGTSFTLSMNVSALELDRHLPDDLIDLTDRFDVDPTRLVVEVTETAALPDRSEAVRLLSTLRALGVGIAIDDFGTGHSSLLQLSHLPITELKIDGSFVQGLPGIRDEAVVRTVRSLAADLELDLVAEGVETTEQLAILIAGGVPKVQGFLTGRPMTAEAFIALLAGSPPAEAEP